jgi:hypothetical protein
MRRRLSIRAIAVSATLILAATTIGAAGVGAVAPGTSDGSGARSTAEAAAPLRPSAKAARGHANKGPVRHGNMAQASQRHSTGSAPRIASPFAARFPAVPGSGPVSRAPVTAPVEATVTANPPIGHPGFEGLFKSFSPDTNGEPPDPYLAVGPEHVMQVVNSSFRITDRQGSQSEPPTSLAGFIDSFTGFPELSLATWFDSRIIFDGLHGRWLLTTDGFDCEPGAGATYGHGYIFFATSDTIDPTGFWTGSYIYYNDYLADFTAPGTSTDKMAFPANVFSMGLSGSCPGDDSFIGPDINVVDWADWLDSNPDWSLDFVLYNDSVATPRVAVQVPATASRLHVILEVASAGPGPNVGYVSITGSAAAQTVDDDIGFDLTGTGVMSEFLVPPPPTQPGPDTIDNAVDERPTDAIWQNNVLSFVSTYPCTPTGDSTPRDCVRVSQLDTTGVSPSNDPSLVQDLLIAENGKDSYMGGVGMAGNGTLHAVWTRSSATAGDFPSSYAAYQLPTDAANAISPKELLKAGTGVYTGTRWGDYVGVAQDPLVPSAVWQGNQYSGTGAEWKTRISRLQPVGATFVPITPLRVLDTRFGTGGLSGKFTANNARTWQVAGVGGIPADAVAVTGNVAVTGQEAAGYLAVTPTPTNTPPSSSINFPLADNRANNMAVALSATGSLSAVYKAATGKKTHLIFDVTGYFLADDTGATFTPLTPVRVLDTRIGTGLTGKFVNSVPRTLTVAGTNGIPLTATAVTGNVTITQQSGPGYFAVTKDPTATPATSTLNFPVSDNRGNGLFAPLNGAGELSMVYKSGTPGATTHVVFDVTGYFEPGTAGLRFVPLNPSRIMDTRSTAVLSGLSGPFAANTARILQVDGHWGVPIGAAAVTGNLSVTGQTGAGYVSTAPTLPPPVPATASLNFPLGDTRGNGLVGPLNGSGDTYLVYVGATGKKAQLILDLSGYFE